MKPHWLLSLLVLGCSNAEQDYGSEANQIIAIGNVPQTIKLATAEALVKCGVPLKGRRVFFHWEGPNDRPAYTIQLSPQLFEGERVTHCLATQLKSQGVDRDIDWGVEPPPPAKEPRR